MKRSALVSFAVAVCIAAAAPGCVSSSATGTTSPGAPPGHHSFEGVARYRGREGPPPGRPFDATFVFKGDVVRYDVTLEGRYVGAVGFDGRSSNLCVQPAGMQRWINVNLQTIGWLFSMLPPSVRRNAIAEVQAQTRWTGRADHVLGRPCRELETRSSDGTELWCYSNEEYFQGADRLIPILRQMGYDNTFIASMSEGGIGWKGLELDKNGVPKLYIELVSLDPRPVDPSMVAGVCAF
jgi:hypothetical protein